MNTELYWRKYKLLPYEKKFGLRELTSLLKPKEIIVHNDKVELKGISDLSGIKELVYFLHATKDGQLLSTIQSQLENGVNNGKQNKQNTRYSVHGLHEYKGKFNPQVVKSLFNIFNVGKGTLILDPFCGSGTTLVEAAQHGISGYGTDINPLAVFITNTKLGALSVTKQDFDKNLDAFWKSYSIALNQYKPESDERYLYLQKWFDQEILNQIECLRFAAEELKPEIKNIILLSISNNLRDYSLQEPSDLRIRRRFSSMPEISLIAKIEASLAAITSNLESFHKIIPPLKTNNKSVNIGIQNAILKNEFKESTFDFAITSPPYATALPYIDTQRLSIVWLRLVSPKNLKALEAELIGSREFSKKSEFNIWQSELMENKAGLPENTHQLCVSLHDLLHDSDGFRKQALPTLLYRYFSNMTVAFSQVKNLLKKEKYFCLIVGHNHTNIGGIRTEIDTPRHLCYIAEQVGFEIYENTELEAYQRYGMHSTNAVQRESLLVFKNR